MCISRCTWAAIWLQKVPHGNLLLRVSGFAEEDQRVTLVSSAGQQSKKSSAGLPCHASLALATQAGLPQLLHVHMADMQPLMAQ